MPLKIFVALSLFISFSCNNPSPKHQLPIQKLPIQVRTDSLSQSKTFLFNDSSDVYKLEVYVNELNRGIIRHRYQGSAFLSDQMTVWSDLLDSLLNDRAVADTFHTLAWGRLSDDQNKDYTLAKRLALAAAADPQWDAQSGKPRTVHINAYVRQLFNDKNLYSELQTLFNKKGYVISFTSAEKVLVQKAQQLPFWEEIKHQVDAEARLPYDCQTWFKLTPVK